MATGSMRKKWRRSAVLCLSYASGQTDKQTDILIAVLRNRRGDEVLNWRLTARSKRAAYQRGADVGECSGKDGDTLVLGERHVRLIVDDHSNAGSVGEISDVLVLVRVERHRQTCKRQTGCSNSAGLQSAVDTSCTAN